MRTFHSTLASSRRPGDRQECVWYASDLCPRVTRRDKRRVPWKFGQPSLRSLSHRPFKSPNRLSIPRHGVLREPTNDKTIVASRPVTIVDADQEPTDRRDDVHYGRGGMDLVPAVFHVVPIIDLFKKVRALERGAGIKEPEDVLHLDESTPWVLLLPRCRKSGLGIDVYQSYFEWQRLCFAHADDWRASMKAREIMSLEVVSVNPDASILEAVRFDAAEPD